MSLVKLKLSMQEGRGGGVTVRCEFSNKSWILQGNKTEYLYVSVPC